MFQFLKLSKRFINIINFTEVTNKRFLSILRPCSFFVNYPSGNRLCCLDKSSIVRTNPSWLVLSRNKYLGKGKRRAKVEDEDSSDEEDEDEDEDSSDKEDEDEGNSDIKTYSLNAVRCDLILKSILRISRKNVEEHFYQNKIRVNGNRLMRKSQNMSIGDEVDVIKNFFPDSDSVIVDRVQIVDVKPDKKTGKLFVKAAKHKALKIKNYSDVDAYTEIRED